jgi:hypothetical protein
MTKILFALLMLLSPVFSFGAGQFSVYDLVCEQQRSPLSIDTQSPRFSWKINSTERDFRQSAYRIIVSSTAEALADNRGDIWDSGKTPSFQSILIPLHSTKNSTPLNPFALYHWKVQIWDSHNKHSAWSEPQTFSTGAFSESDWGDAAWIALEPDVVSETSDMGRADIREAVKERKAPEYKLPQFSRKITVAKPLRRAMAYVAGLGHFDFFVNGQKVGDHFLDAGWTKFDRQALYVAFDITGNLSQGNNTLGVMLGNGFFHTPTERYLKILLSFGAPKMKALVRLEYTDGTTDTVVSDTDWQAEESPILFSSIYGGEDYDAKKTNPIRILNPVKVDYKAQLTAMTAPPLTVHSEILPVRIYRNGKGLWLYDLGQNFSGIIRVALKSANSRTVVFRPAELLNPDSTVNQSASGRPFLFRYTTAGGNRREEWQPQFTYYGFRYVEVEGAVPEGRDNPDELPEILSLSGLHTCNSAPEAGTFTCSKPIFNRIHDLIDWAIRSNMASVLTDCPHREKLGWLEQAHLMQFALQYRYNLSRLYPKIMNDMLLSQLDNGCIPTIAPEYVRFANGFEDTPEWGSAFIICPWYVYQWYGDRRLLENYYPAMQRYLDYLTSRADNGIVSYGLGDWFDIGPNNPGYAQLTSNALSATAIYYYNTTIMRDIAMLLNKTDDAERYKKLAANIKNAFNSRFFNLTTRQIEHNSQTANAMALYMGLVDNENQPQIMQNLINDIQQRGNALTAGDVGYRYVLRTLEAAGRSDVIYDMNTRYDKPGYGWMLAHDATALTESWQAYGFVSNNHFMLGHLMEWLYSGLGGIRQKPGSTAFNEIVIAPQTVGDVNFARTSLESPYGTIRCDWEKADTYRLNVTVPANCSAEIELPTAKPEQVSVYGIKLQKMTEISIIKTENDKIWVKTGSGNYRFEVNTDNNK